MTPQEFVTFLDSVPENQRFYAGIGSRETPLDVCFFMSDIAAWLAARGWWLRSGGAVRADTAFAQGARNRKNVYYADSATERSMEIAKLYHPAWDRLQKRGRLLMGRNTFQVFGGNLENPKPSAFVACWTPRGVIEGGTGQAMRIALNPEKVYPSMKPIPVFNLKNIEDHIMFKGALKL